MREEARRPSSVALRHSLTYRSVARILSLFSVDPPDLETAAGARREGGGDRDSRIGSGPDERRRIDPSTADDLFFADEVPEFGSPDDEIGLLELQKELGDCIHGGDPKEAEARVPQARRGEGSSGGSVDLAYVDPEAAGSRGEGAAEERMPCSTENGTENGSKDTETLVDGCTMDRDAKILDPGAAGAHRHLEFCPSNEEAACGSQHGLNSSGEHENLVICNTGLVDSMAKQPDEGHGDQKATILGAQDGIFSSLDEACSATRPRSVVSSNADSNRMDRGIVGEREDPATGIEQVGSEELTEVQVTGSLDVGEEGEIEEGEIMNEFGGSDTSVSGSESSDAEVGRILEEPTSCHSQKLPASVSLGGAPVADTRKVERRVARFGESRLLDYCDLDLLKDGPVDDDDNKRERVGAKMKSRHPEEDVKNELDKSSLDPSERKRSKSKDVEVLDKKKRVMTEERKAKKKIAKKRKRAETNKKLGVKRLKIKPVLMPKKVVHCNFYLNGRCHQTTRSMFCWEMSSILFHTVQSQCQ